MRYHVAASALFALAAAQSRSGTIPSITKSDENIQPSVTETVSGPINTQKACGQISQIVSSSDLEYPSVEAELAYACLTSVPIDVDAASVTIDSLKQMLQFQTTLNYLKSPPQGYPNAGVDLLGGLTDIDNKLTSYKNQYDFETDIASLFVKAHDGHLAFEGMAFSGAFRWRRSRQVSLLSGSADGIELPEVWAAQDFNKTNAGYTASGITRINGQDVQGFLQQESLLSSYHDPDTRFNTLFYMQPAESYGYFTNPKFYPGSTLNITFGNGTEHMYINAAVILDRDAWGNISDGQTFYDTYISSSYTTQSKVKRRNSHGLPRNLEHPKEAELSRRYIPAAYPEPLVEHSADDVTLAGYVIGTAAGTIGILMIQTFNTESNSDAEEFQAVVQSYIQQTKNQGITKHIIDVRTNGGGKVLLGYDTYKQFFPSQEPQLQSRYRGSQSTVLFGQNISTVPFNSRTGEIYTSPWNYHSYLNKDLKPFNSWHDIYPPTTFNNDNFTDLLRYNLSDPLVTSSDTYSIGVTMTGYGDRSNFTTDPFAAEDIIILSDGICASTCSLFVELMVQQSGVRTLAIGGRPMFGPMQAVGGTKGSLVLQGQYLTSVAAYVIQAFAASTAQAKSWASFLPNYFGINVNDATVNFQDNIRKGLENDGLPTQFINDTASCRIWYTPTMYLNVSEVWEKAARVGFGGDNGTLDESACIAGSVTTREQQTGRGEGNPAISAPSPTVTGSAKPSKSKGAAAGISRTQEGWRAVLVCSVMVLVSMILGTSLV